MGLKNIGGTSGALGASGINQVVSMIVGGVLGAAGSVAGDIIAVKGDFSQLNVWKVVGKAAIMGAIGVGLEDGLEQDIKKVH